MEKLVARLISRRHTPTTTATDRELGEFLYSTNQGPWSIQEICWHLPKDLVCELWRRAATQAIGELSQQRATIRILKTHFVYYRGETYEFFSPFAASFRKLLSTHPTLKLSTILVLIDDIYDMYARLAHDGEVFDFSAQLREEFTKIATDEQKLRDQHLLPKNGVSVLLQPAERYRISLSLIVRNLQRVLTWRENEILAGQHAGQSFNAQTYILATKHPTEIAVALLTTSPPIRLTYLSHPISRPRRSQISDTQGRWPSFVFEYHAFIRSLNGLLEKTGCIPIMPTAIDEFRLRTEKLIFRTADHKPCIKEVFVPSLRTRWPLCRTNPTELLYDLPAQYNDYESFEAKEVLPDIFNPPIDPDDPTKRFAKPGEFSWMKLPESTMLEISGVLRSLHMNIEKHMSGRDHLLVRQCHGFLLYRPLFGESGFSGGVSAELDNWEALVRVQNAIAETMARPILFIHHEDDRKDIALEEEARARVKQRALTLLSEATGKQFTSLGGADIETDDWFESVVTGKTGSLEGGKLAPAQAKKARLEKERILQEVQNSRDEEYANLVTNGALAVPLAVVAAIELRRDLPQMTQADFDRRSHESLWNEEAARAMATWQERIART